MVLGRFWSLECLVSYLTQYYSSSKGRYCHSHVWQRILLTDTYVQIWLPMSVYQLVLLIWALQQNVASGVVATDTSCCCGCAMLLGMRHVAGDAPCCWGCAMLLVMSHVAGDAPFCSWCAIILVMRHDAGEAPCCKGCLVLFLGIFLIVPLLVTNFLDVLNFCASVICGIFFPRLLKFKLFNTANNPPPSANRLPL